MKRLSVCLSLVFALVVAVPAFAQVGKGLSGAHWNLNIIGVPKDKTVPDMTGSDRHVIFVPLQSGGDVNRQVKIYFERGDRFKVTDGNATDDNEATFQVPYEFCPDLTQGCEELLSFDVYAVGLGKPFTGAVVEAECTYSEDVPDATCTDTLLMGSFEVNRQKGKPQPPINITDVFRPSGCLDLNGSECNAGDLAFSNLWIFNIAELVEHWWIDNNGLKLMLVRFYETTSGSIGTVVN
jgi:hypothetical protein